MLKRARVAAWLLLTTSLTVPGALSAQTTAAGGEPAAEAEAAEEAETGQMGEMGASRFEQKAAKGAETRAMESPQMQGG